MSGFIRADSVGKDNRASSVEDLFDPFIPKGAFLIILESEDSLSISHTTIILHILAHHRKEFFPNRGKQRSTGIFVSDIFCASAV